MNSQIEIEELIESLVISPEEETLINQFLENLFKMKDNFKNFHSKYEQNERKTLNDIEKTWKEFENMSFFQKIKEKFSSKNFFSQKIRELNPLNFLQKNEYMSLLFLVFIIKSENIIKSKFEEFISQCYYYFGNKYEYIMSIFSSGLGFLVSNSLGIIIMSLGLSWLYYKQISSDMRIKNIQAQFKKEYELTIIKTIETGKKGEEILENGIKKIERILKEQIKLKKTIFLFLNKTPENNCFFEMLKNSFKNTNIIWLDNSSEITLLKSKNKESISPYLIISSMQFFKLLNESEILDSMFLGLIIYTQNIIKFKEIYKKENLEWINEISDDPYTVFEKTKTIIENLNLEIGRNFCFNMYYIATRFEKDTIRCLSSNILYCESLEKLSTFSVKKLLFIVNNSEEFKDFRLEFNIKNIDTKKLIKILKNDVSEYNELIKANLPIKFVNYFFNYPINPLDEFYEIMYSDNINKQITKKKEISNISSIKKEALLARADYLKILFKLMKILRKKSSDNHKIKKILRLYTKESYFNQINKYFILMNYNIIEHFKNFLAIFYYSFINYKDNSPLPKKLYRGAIEDSSKFKKLYKIGDQLIFPQFLSTSISKNTCKNYGRILFVIKTNNNLSDETKPKNLKNIAKFPIEEEYLFKCFSCFEILKIKEVKDKRIFDYECKIKHILK